ncbi:MAG: MoaD/ThiS family protein [Proteobacteria bacterium]|nr:MoaD/ThiS family protein [Pseudomonadota bacterium]
MKVKVKFLGFNFAQIQRELEIELKGHKDHTVSDLVRELSNSIKKFKDAVLKENGSISEEVMIVLNGEIQAEREKIDTIVINEGDTIAFMLIAGGG